MLWLTFGLPAVVVAAAVATIAVAAGDGGTDTVGDDVRRVAQVQVAANDNDVEAARRGVRAQLHRDEAGVVVTMLAGDIETTEPLRLVLRHPARASADLVTSPVAVEAASGSRPEQTLGATGDAVAVADRRRDGAALPSRPWPRSQWDFPHAMPVGAAMAGTGDAETPRTWRATVSPSPTHAWNVELSGLGWRLKGRWQRGANVVDLAPAWPAVADRP